MCYNQMIRKVEKEREKWNKSACRFIISLCGDVEITKNYHDYQDYSELARLTRIGPVSQTIESRARAGQSGTGFMTSGQNFTIDIIC